MTSKSEPTKESTLESLFIAYANHMLPHMEEDEQFHESIVVSQIDFWLERAKLLRTTFKRTETGMAYAGFQKWRLDLENFKRFLDEICKGKDITVEQVTAELMLAPPPGNSDNGKDSA